MPNNRMSDLAKILPPPAEAPQFNEELLDWNQNKLSTLLPDDFIEFGRVYGSGTIETAYSWEVCSPFRVTFPMFVMDFARICHLYKDAAEPEGVPFGIFPEVGGVLPFAKTPDGDTVGWITAGEPNSWKVVDMHDYEVGDFEIFDLSFSEYFLNVLTRKIVLRRHQGGDEWDPAVDIKFDDFVSFDKPFSMWPTVPGLLV
jgi:hypothetical protein